METDIRPEVSEKNKYWIDREKYYELKHFCRRYAGWKKTYSYFRSGKSSWNFGFQNRSKAFDDPTANLALMMTEFSYKIELVEKTAREADADLAKYILLAVTEGFSYDYLKNVLDMPCSKDMFYDRYRKFFWLLSKNR